MSALGIGLWGLALVLTVALVVVCLGLRRRAAEVPVQHRLSEIDPDEIARTVDRQLDEAPWRLDSERDGVAVFSAGGLDCPFVGFRTVTEHRAPLETLVSFLADDLLGAFSQLNDRYVSGEELAVLDGARLRIVRTSFSMPWPLSGREFVHLLYKKQVTPDRWLIVYYSVDEPDLPPPARGFVRCPIYPSGQRLTRLSDGRVRVEHLMVYDLAGKVSSRAQNLLMRQGHVKAYHKEWRGLLRWSAGRAPGEASTSHTSGEAA